MSKTSTGCLLLILGLAVAAGLSFAEWKWKTKLFDLSLQAQNKIAKPPKHVLFYLFKIFEWLALGLSWVAVFGTLYLEFDKINGWKLVLGSFFLGFSVIWVNVLLAGGRPLFFSNTLAACNCDCSFGGADFYTGFVLFVWVTFMADVIGDRDFIAVSVCWEFCLGFNLFGIESRSCPAFQI